MIIGPKYKIAKRLGAPIFEKTQTQKFALSEARGSRVNAKKGKMASDYKRQLIEKQKMRFSYGISEKQLSKYVHEAFEQGHQPIAQLIARLESRLDNVVYRLGLTKTRRLARQIVSHGHVWINDRRLNIPSHKVNVGDRVSIRKQSQESALFLQLRETLPTVTTPPWLTLNAKEMSGIKKSEPTLEQTETLFDTQQVLEYYSR